MSEITNQTNIEESLIK